MEQLDPCPTGCGRATDDAAGGPCSDCWAETDEEYSCTHCGGEGFCLDPGSDPEWDCPETVHGCHSCNGTGERKHQTVF